MPGEKHPIIAHGELYVEPIVKKSRPIDKSIPHEYEDAKQRILSDISDITEKIEIQEEFFLDEKILCVRMEPKFEAKSYVPASITQVSDSISLVGGRKYRFVDNQGDPQSAKLYFMKTTNAGIAALQSALEYGKKDTVKSWRNQIGSIRSIDLLSPDEKVMGFDDEWETGTVEIVLHPLSNENADMIDLFYRVSEIPVGKTQVRQYEDGFTFISAACTYENIENIKRLNFLRAVHPLGQISIAPVRDHPGVEAPTIEPSRQKSSITVGVFDGGSNPSIPLLSGYVNEHNCVSSAAHPELVAHGTGVCGVVLHGNLAGKTKADHLSVPCVSVESFRVLPLQDGSDFELYEAIDAIENTVLARPDIKLYNISFGPKGAIVDDSISRFTYVLDRLTYDVPDDDINPLFSVAVGNDGDLTYPCNRIQAPADMVNGLGVGAYSIARDGRKIRADYSCIGEGREGAKIKPDFLEFGGSLDRPFIIAGTTPNTLSASAGTSFSSPLAVNKIGRLMAKSESITPHIGRTLLIHNAQIDSHLTQEEQGYGFCAEEMDNVLNCEDKKVTILYSGTLAPSQTVRLPVFAPQINNVCGNVTITWTVATIVDPFIGDPDAYTNNCIEDTFFPHEMVFMFSKKGVGNRKLNLLNEKHIAIARDLLNTGYQKADFPVSHPSKKYWDETDLRAIDMKWDTVIRRYVRMRGSSLLNPAITLHAIARNGFGNAKLRYFAAVSIEAPRYIGSLYDAILQNYKNLTPIEIRNVNRIMVDR
ncbi:MAG: S8 family peptidase [Oscillospiraceae bacterium]